MKKLLLILPLVFLLCFTFSCQKQEQIERIMEDGVEVVINHLEPYKIKGKPSILHLEKEYVIDTEDDEIADLGLTDIGAFDVDSEGNIYMVSPMAKENTIFKFDSNGNYVHSFCRMGQGPGEMPYPPWTLNITSQDEITATNAMNKKLLIFNNDGNFVEETPIALQAPRIYGVTPLKNGNYLCIKVVSDPKSDYLFQFTLGLQDSEFKEINDLNVHNEPNHFKGQNRQGIFTFCHRITKDKIFVGNDSRGYEIWVFDLDGNLMRKIRKDYEKVPITREFMEETMKALDEPRRKMTIFPESFPPFQGFFTDDKGGLYVMTYEKGENSKEYIIDIFNADGIFVGRKSFRIFFSHDDDILLWATVKQNLLYCKNEKESGFKELVVYKMTWE